MDEKRLASGVARLCRAIRTGSHCGYGTFLTLFTHYHSINSFCPPLYPELTFTYPYSAINKLQSSRMASESTTTFDTQATQIPNLQLVFSKDNPSNTVLTPSHGSGPCYSAISTSNHGSNMITTYRKSEKGPTDDWESQPIVATLKWREVFSDKLMLGDGSVDDSNILKSRPLSM